MNRARVARRLAGSPGLTAVLSLVLPSIVAFSACFSSPNPNLYALYPQAGAKRGVRALRVELRRPSIPAYLDRPQIVRRVGLGRLELAGNDWWGSPFEEMVGRTMAMNLSERLPNSTVYTEAGTISTRPDVVVQLEIQRFEPIRRGSVELLAQVALHFPEAPTKTVITRHELTARVEGDSAAAIVKAMSLLLAELSDQIAQSIAQRAPPHRAGSAKASISEHQ